MRAWARLRRAWDVFSAIDGTQWAGALAYSAFASLFPMMLLFITAASFFIDRDRAGATIVGFVQSYVPMSAEMQRLVLEAVAGMVEARGRAGAAALIVLIWTSSRCFSTLVQATNRAWGIAADDWWRLPLRSLALLAAMAAAAPVAMTFSTLIRIGERFVPAWLFRAETLLLPAAIELFSLVLFYRFAPRRRTRFGEVWSAALAATLFLRAAENAFVLYLSGVADSNAVYGVFGDVMALLLWIYLSGCVFIFGACLCAARGAEAAALRGSATIA